MAKLTKEKIPYTPVPDDIVEMLNKHGIDTAEKLQSFFEPNLYAIIPADILERKDLSANAKLLYAEINALSKKSGVCFARNEYLAERMGLAERSVSKIVSELDSKGLVRVHIKKDKKGTFRTIKVTWGGYAIERTPPTLSSVPGNAPQRIQKRIRKEELEKENTSIELPLAAGPSVNGLIDEFEPMNPAFARLFANKSQRAALERLVAKYGFEKIQSTVRAAAAAYGQEFAPTITTPVQLESKLGSLIAFYKRVGAKGPAVVSL